MWSNQSNTNEYILISLFGYAQSGKTSRNRCIESQLRNSIVERGGNFVEIDLGIEITTGKGGRQSRHITPKGFSITMQRGEIITISVDYTGQDHIAAYYIILGMLQLITDIERDEELKKALPDVIKRITEVSKKILDLFVNPTVGSINKNELNDLISNPYKPLLDSIEPHLKDQNKFNKIESNVKSTYDHMLQIIMKLSYGFVDIEQAFKLIKSLINKDTINVVELNRILCKIDKLNVVDTAKNEINYDKICDGGLSSIYIKDISIYQYLRYIITGPLLAYLLIGFMIYSNIVYLMIPSDKVKWYQQIIDIYEGMNPHLILLNFLTNAPGANEVVYTACREFIHTKRGEDSEFIENICGNLFSRFNQKAYIAESELEGLLKELEEIGEKLKERSIDHKEFFTYIIGSIFNKYHFELFNVLLRILERCLRNLYHGTAYEKSFVISLTYSDGMKLSDFYNRIKREAGLYEFETAFRNIINGLKILGIRKVYVIPSSLMSGECTVFEAAMLICNLESLATITVSYSPGVANEQSNSEFTINCSALLRETSSLFDAFFAENL